MKNEVLFVDDETVILQLAQRYLGKEEYHVTAMESGENIREVIEERHPSVIFLDIMMPKINGMDVLKEIKRIYPQVPVVMVSGHLNSDLAQQAARQGACDYLLKPIDWEQLKHMALLYSILGEAA